MVTKQYHLTVQLPQKVLLITDYLYLPLQCQDEEKGCPQAKKRLSQVVRNDDLDAPKSQNTEPESNPGQNPLQTARLIVATSPPGPKPLAVLQDSASKPPVQDAKNFPKVPTPDTSSLPSEIDKSPPGNYSKLSQSPKEGTEPKEAPNI
ncbi:hypothetical protein DSO57_1025209 [Entomophthora muscae]|uniref:Uncharacterized protein n=1 Tax=Entomophthora muscae TaxID=34485 RepID=A0ACC2S4C8_9FUNG|nr:hypothetical protein DSO57_1025209 [Entomophthora muscae]